MNFNKLDSQTKEKLHNELLSYATNLGGKNFFLQLIEDVKKEKTHPLTNKSCVYHFSKGKLSWNKAIFKNTLDLLIKTVKEENSKEQEQQSQKTKKNIINMMKTLKPIMINVKPKHRDDGEGFSLNIIDTSDEKSIEISLIFKIIFVYNIDFAKQVLNYKV